MGGMVAYDVKKELISIGFLLFFFAVKGFEGSRFFFLSMVGGFVTMFSFD